MLALAGCATLFNKDTRLNKDTRPIALVSTPAGAEVWMNGQRRGVTPITLELDNHNSHTVTFRKEGHREIVCQLTASVGTGWVILDVLGGLVPIIVDAATGAWKSLDQESCNAALPETGGVRSTGQDGEVQYLYYR